jgi:hypothetical protein
LEEAANHIIVVSKGLAGRGTTVTQTPILGHS